MADPQMYTHIQQQPQASYQLPQEQYYPSIQAQEGYQHSLASGIGFSQGGGYQLPKFAQGAYTSSQGASSYQIPQQQSSYELPPSTYSNEGYSSFDYPTSYGMSYESFAQPDRHFSNQNMENDYNPAYQPYQESVDVPEAQVSPGYSHAMDRMSLNNNEAQGLGRIRTGGGGTSGDDYGQGGSSSSARQQRRGGRKGKETAVREAQTARLPFRNKDDRTTFMEPSTARLDGSAGGQKTIDRFQARFANKDRVEHEWTRRQLGHHTHPQELAAQVCEIKINHPGVESSIGHNSFLLVQKFNDPEYLYDYQGWTVCYRMRVNSLRAYYHRKKHTAEEIKEKLLSNYRELKTTFHGTMADPNEEKADMKRARDVWMHFYKARLAGVTRKDSELTVPMIAQQAMEYSDSKKMSPYDTMVMIKKYMRIALDFTYLQIEELDSLMRSRLASGEE